MGTPRQRKTPAVEWIAGIMGALIVAGTIGYLVFAALQPGSDAPALSVKVTGVHQRGGSFVVDVEVRNSSRRAAADVHLAGMAASPDGRTAHPQARVDYVPGLSTRTASLVFEVNPGPGADVRVVGYPCHRRKLTADS